MLQMTLVAIMAPALLVVAADVVPFHDSQFVALSFSTFPAGRFCFAFPSCGKLGLLHVPDVLPPAPVTKMAPALLIGTADRGKCGRIGHQRLTLWYQVP